MRSMQVVGLVVAVWVAGFAGQADARTQTELFAALDVDGLDTDHMRGLVMRLGADLAAWEPGSLYGRYGSVTRHAPRGKAGLVPSMAEANPETVHAILVEMYEPADSLEQSDCLSLDYVAHQGGFTFLKAGKMIYMREGNQWVRWHGDGAEETPEDGFLWQLPCVDLSDLYLVASDDPIVWSLLFIARADTPKPTDVGSLIGVIYLSMMWNPPDPMGGRTLLSTIWNPPDVALILGNPSAMWVELLSGGGWDDIHPVSVDAEHLAASDPSTPAPEPATMSLLVLGGLALLYRRRIR